MQKYGIKIGALPTRKANKIDIPSLAAIAQRRLAEIAAGNREFIVNTGNRQGSLSAVDRILAHGRNELGEKLTDTRWFRQQLRLTADYRLAHVFTSGASQISKSLANYLVAIDTLLNGQVNIGWFYASRQSLYNQQPEQFQAMVRGWLLSESRPIAIERDAITRFTIDKATGHFSHVNSDSDKKIGGAAEGKEATAFSASVLFLEERSNHRGNVDQSPRLGASKILSKPIRELGTPGGGNGIGKLMEKSAHLFCPALPCPHCGEITWLEPKGALLKGQINPKNNHLEFFGNRGEILDYYSIDGTPQTAYIACVICDRRIPTELIIDCQLYSKQSLATVDDFLDALPDEIYPGAIAIYLSPFLRCPTDPLRIQGLIEQGLDPLNPLIYCQNKLGYESELGGTGVSIEQFNAAIKLPLHIFASHKKVIRIAGIDQNRGMHHIVIGDLVLDDRSQINIIHVGMVGQADIRPTLEKWQVNYALIDNEPDRIDTYRICQEMRGKLHLGDQRDIKDAYTRGTVSHGDQKMPCFFLSNQLFIEQVVKNWTSESYRIGCKLPPNFGAHITSMHRTDIKWVRPENSEDHYFFAMLFMEAAIVIYHTDHKITRQQVTGQPLKQL